LRSPTANLGAGISGRKPLHDGTMGSTRAATLGDPVKPLGRSVQASIRSASSTSATAHAPEPEVPAMEPEAGKLGSPASTIASARSDQRERQFNDKARSVLAGAAGAGEFIT
jgi:hypothetical protein